MKKQIFFKWLLFPFLLLSILPCGFGFDGLAVVLTGILIAWYTARFGLQYTLWSIVPLFLCGSIIGELETGIFLCLHGMSAFVIGLFIYKRWAFSGLLIASTLIETTVLVLYTLFLCNILQTNPADLLFGETLRQFSEILASSGQLNGNALLEMKATIHMFADMLQSMLPFFYLTVSLLYIYLLFGVTRFCLKKQDALIDTMPYFYELWLPGGVSGIFVLLFLVSFFTDSPVLTNVISFMFMIHVICGVSVIDYFMRKKDVPSGLRAVILAVLLMLSSLMGGIATSILCCIGMTDGTRGIRR